eukprot:gene17469-biopygen12816
MGQEPHGPRATQAKSHTGQEPHGPRATRAKSHAGQEPHGPRATRAKSHTGQEPHGPGDPIPDGGAGPRAPGPPPRRTAPTQRQRGSRIPSPFGAGTLHRSPLRDRLDPRNPRIHAGFAEVGLHGFYGSAEPGPR